MYSTCIHCGSSLGTNQAIEAFQVGERIAFDPQKGRLWVVCRSCERWNLSPLDERWEAIENAEKRFRDSRLRVSTDEVGLARLREGLDLIRIGNPLRPEMAAWRYGDQFGRRRKKQLLLTGAAVGAVATVFGAVIAVGVSAGAFAGVYANVGLWDTLIYGKPQTVVARIVTAEGAKLVVHRRHARMSALEHDWEGSDGTGFRLRLEHSAGTQVVVGVEAMRIAAQIMPAVNRFGASRSGVQDAVRLLEEEGDPARVLRRVQRTFGARERERPKYPKTGHAIALQKVAGTLHSLPIRERLAMEMALHDESERRAMDGELEALTRAWRDAETIAGIADDMFVTPAIDARLAALHANDAR